MALSLKERSLFEDNIPQSKITVADYREMIIDAVEADKAGDSRALDLFARIFKSYCHAIAPDVTY